MQNMQWTWLTADGLWAGADGQYIDVRIVVQIRLLPFNLLS